MILTTALRGVITVITQQASLRGPLAMNTVRFSVAFRPSSRWESSTWAPIRITLSMWPLATIRWRAWSESALLVVRSWDLDGVSRLFIGICWEMLGVDEISWMLMGISWHFMRHFLPGSPKGSGPCPGRSCWKIPKRRGSTSMTRWRSSMPGSSVIFSRPPGSPIVLKCCWWFFFVHQSVFKVDCFEGQPSKYHLVI